MTAHRVASLADLSDESATFVEVGGVPVCLARSQGEVFAVNDICTHGQVSLSEGDVEDGFVECWLHGSRFDLRSGQPSGLPATQPVATYSVRIEEDDVYVDVSAEVGS